MDRLGVATRCALICDIAEGGEIYLSAATAALLEDEDLGELTVEDRGELRERGGPATASTSSSSSATVSP